MVLEHVIHNSRHFFGHDGSGDGSGRFTGLGLVEAFDFEVVLHGMDSDFGEGELEIFVAVFVAGLMFEFLVGIAGAGDQSTVGEEVFFIGKAFDAIDLQVEREGGDFTDAWRHEQTLDIGVGYQMGMQGFLQCGDLIAKQGHLIDQTTELNPIFTRQRKSSKFLIAGERLQMMFIRREVEFFAEAVNTIDATDAFMH